MAVKRGLGSGLDNLIPDLNYERKSNEKVIQTEKKISINDVEPNRDQPRKSFDEEALNELADSIKRYGIIEPLIVQKKGKRFEIIAGERRFRAARIAGLKEIPVIVKEFAPEDVLTIALLENIQREDLNPIEEATAFQRLIDDLKLKQEEIAERVSKKRSTITNSMRLLKLPEEVKKMVAGGQISEGHGRALLGLDDKEEIVKVAKKIASENWSVRATEEYVKKTKEAASAKTKKKSPVIKREAVYREAENKMKRSLGAKVEIKKKNDKSGKIEISYYSIDELERLIELFEQAGKGAK